MGLGHLAVVGRCESSTCSHPCLIRFTAVQVKSLERSRAEEEVVPSGDVARHLLDAIATARSGGGGPRSGGLDPLRAASTVAVRAAAAAATAETEGGGGDEEGSGQAVSWRDKRRRRQRQDAD